MVQKIVLAAGIAFLGVVVCLIGLKRGLLMLRDSRRVFSGMLLGAVFLLGPVIGFGQNKKAPTAKERAIVFCREQSLARLKYVKTVEWLDGAKEETPGTWFVSGVRTAAGPSGEVDQIYGCRVQIVADKPTLKMIQIFKEASKSGKDIFEVTR